MKKKLTKKLELSRETVRHLDETALEQAAGGFLVTVSLVVPRHIACCASGKNCCP